MTKKLLSYLLPISQFVTLGLVLVLLLSGSSQSLGGTTNYDALDVTDGYYVDGVQVISGSGALILGSSGTTINQYKCYTNTSYNPAAIASSSAPASVAFLTPSATVGDVMIVTLGTVTSTDLWTLSAKVTAGSGTAGATTTLYVHPGFLAGVDLSTTTAKVCIVN